MSKHQTCIVKNHACYHPGNLVSGKMFHYIKYPSNIHEFPLNFLSLNFIKLSGIYQLIRAVWSCKKSSIQAKFIKFSVRVLSF